MYVFMCMYVSVAPLWRGCQTSVYIDRLHILHLFTDYFPFIYLSIHIFCFTSAREDPWQVYFWVKLRSSLCFILVCIVLVCVWRYRSAWYVQCIYSVLTVSLQSIYSVLTVYLQCPYSVFTGLQELLRVEVKGKQNLI